MPLAAEDSIFVLGTYTPPVMEPFLLITSPISVIIYTIDFSCAKYSGFDAFGVGQIRRVLHVFAHNDVIQGVLDRRLDGCVISDQIDA